MYRAHRMCRIVAVGLLSLLLSGCITGRVFQHTVEPLLKDFRRTPTGVKSGSSDVKRFRYSFADISWDTNAIGDIARAHGLDEVYYADLEIWSILDIWTQQWVIVYGR